MGKSPPSTSDAGDLAALNEQTAGAAQDPAAVTVALQTRIAELEAQLASRASATAVKAKAPVSGAKGTYYHQQGIALVGRPVLVDGDTLRDPDTGDVLVTKAKASEKPANGCYVPA